jgi:L-ascorbate metabolism protein UlaG (beta-lactamase superfamily)
MVGPSGRFSNFGPVLEPRLPTLCTTRKGWGTPLKIYHAGDTAVFGDMQIIRELYAPDIALLPIGDHYVMSPREAAYACKLLKTKAVVPMHFGTFPVLSGTPAQLKQLVKDVEVVEMKPGQTL